jgi:hypothetical protein
VGRGPVSFSTSGMNYEMFSGDALAVTSVTPGSGAGNRPVETATVHAASWFGSRGRLPLPMLIKFRRRVFLWQG